MRGISELEWAFVQLAILLVFITWAISPLYKSLDVSQQNSARLNAQEIAGVINMMKTSYSDMSYTVSLPPYECNIDITEGFVRFNLSSGGKSQISIVDIIQTPVKVSSSHHTCDLKKNTLTIMKSKDGIKVV